MKRLVAYGIVLVVLLVAFMERVHHGHAAWNEALDWVTKPMSIAAGALLGLELLFDKYCWRWLPLFLTRRPDLQGTWKARLHTVLLNPDTGERWEPTVAYLVVKQTFSELHVRLLTNRSSSRSIAVDLEVRADGSQRLVAIYQNTPERSERDGPSQIHFGGMILSVSGTPPSQLNGHYWTDRNPQSQGDLGCTERKTDLFDTFEAADMAFGAAPSIQEADRSGPPRENPGQS